MKGDWEFLNLLETVVKRHKCLITKLSKDVIEAKLPALGQILTDQKAILEEERNLSKTLCDKKLEYGKLKEREQLLKKSLIDGLA
jgi:hypothetical protein